MNKLLTTIAATALLTACATESPTPAPETSAPATQDANSTPEVVTVASVVDNSGPNGQGPMLCYTISTATPPQCGGLFINNWSWDDVEGEQTADGVTWKENLVLIGKLANDSWTVTQKPVEKTKYTGELPATFDDRSAYFDPGCTKPADGWQTPNPNMAKDADIVTTITPSVRKAVDATPDPSATYKGVEIPGYSDSWTNYYNKETGEILTGNQHTAPGDAPPILTVALTGEKEAAEKAIRKTWGGPLCFVDAKHSRSELQQVVNDLFAMKKVPAIGALVTGGVVGGKAVFDVEYDDGSLQKYVDDKYGKGMAEIHSIMQPTGK